MIEHVLPQPTVSAVEAFGDPADAADALFPAEDAIIARAVEKRRREFTTVRLCARAALAELGLRPAPILLGPRGAPIWPDGITGSMTHCAGYRAAAVGWRRDLLSVGIDAEPHERLPDGVLRLISLPPERLHLADLQAIRSDVHWDRLLFSAKEAVYKAWSPLTGRWLNFDEAQLTIDPAAGTFQARLLVGGSVYTDFEGRWLATGGFVLTAVVVPA